MHPNIDMSLRNMSVRQCLTVRPNCNLSKRKKLKKTLSVLYYRPYVVMIKMALLCSIERCRVSTVNGRRENRPFHRAAVYYNRRTYINIDIIILIDAINIHNIIIRRYAATTTTALIVIIVHSLTRR